MKIGNYNLFETGCTVSSSEIGDFNEFQFKSFVEDNCRVGSHCFVCPKVTLSVGTKMTDYLVAYEDGKFMSNAQSAGNENKKGKMRELCGILSTQLQKHGNLRKV